MLLYQLCVLLCTPSRRWIVWKLCMQRLKVHTSVTFSAANFVSASWAGTSRASRSPASAPRASHNNNPPPPPDAHYTKPAYHHRPTIRHPFTAVLYVDYTLRCYGNGTNAFIHALLFFIQMVTGRRKVSGYQGCRQGYGYGDEEDTNV